MSTAGPTDTVETLADLLKRLGGIAPGRVVLKPAPGKATEKDLLRLARRTGRLYELVEGTLVEKVMGYGEGFLAADVIRLLGRFLDQNDLGEVGGADATMRLMPGWCASPTSRSCAGRNYPTASGRPCPSPAWPGPGHRGTQQGEHARRDEAQVERGLSRCP
jgi:hypothetical protein